MDPKKIRKLYMQHMPHMNKALKFVQTQLADMPPSDFTLETSVKPYPSTKRKMIANRIKEPSQLSDLVRGRLYFSDQFDYPEVVAILQQIFGKKISSIDIKHDTDHGLRYDGVYHVDMNIDGVNFELQVMPCEFKPHREFLHDIYSQLRDKGNSLSEDEKKKLQHIHNKITQLINQQVKNNRTKNSDDA